MNEPTVENFSPNYNPRRIFKLRKKNAQNNLQSNITLLGFILIIYQHIKFSTSAWILILRIILQTILSSPFPTDEQMMRVVQRVRSDNSNNSDSSTHEPVTNDNHSHQIPGGFDEQLEEGEDQSTTVIDDVLSFKKRLRSSLLHALILIDISILLYRLFNPIDYVAKINEKQWGDDDVKNVPSIFLNGDGIAQGEFRGRLTFQLIGDSIPTNNFWANIYLWSLDFFIFMSQFSLLTLTGVNFAKIGYVEPHEIRYGKSDGYDGYLVATRIDYTTSLDELLS